MEPIHTRVIRLERGVRQQRLALMVVVGVVGVVILGGAFRQPTTQDELRLQRLVIVDGQGRERIIADGGSLYWLDENGLRRMSAATGAGDITVFSLADSEGRPRLLATTDEPNSRSGLALLDNDGELRFDLTTGPDDAASMLAYDTKGTKRILLVTDTEGCARIAWIDEHGNPRIDASTGPGGSVGLPTEDLKR